MTAPIKTTCPYCGVGCGILARAQLDGSVSIKGDPDHPANFGRLCSKGSALGETLSLDDRLLYPMVHGQRVAWSEALDTVAAEFARSIADHGRDSVAMYVSGQILTEDYYAANKLMKGFIGSANIDTNSRLCMASSVAGHKRAFGSDTVPGNYSDLEEADLVILVGSNLAWCHPVLFQRLLAAREKRGTKIVVVDPRKTASAEIADLHLALEPGTDVLLFNGLLLAIAGANSLDQAFVAKHTTNFLATFEAALAMPISAIARKTGLSQTEIYAFYDLFVRTERTVTVFSQGVNQSTAGTDKVNAIINCHLATGRIGRPGMGPFSVTGQPNAMGGREVGGLANMLAAHMELDNPEHQRTVQRFWKSPTIATTPGLKAVDLFKAVADGRIKALWIMATNPIDSMPDADAVRAAIRQCPFVVVSDVVSNTDTTALGHVLLPALAWGEKDGTVTNSERRISRQRAFLPAPGEARADWWQVAQVAQRMGFSDAFDWQSPADLFNEYAALTGENNNGRRDLDLSDRAHLSATDYAELAPFQWPRNQERMFADGNFFTPDRKARFVPTPYRAPAEAISDRYPLRLNTGRVRDQWHTMTRTGKTARLQTHIAEPYIEIHPSDARKANLHPAELATVSSPRGTVTLRVLISERQLPGMAFAPIHWTDQTASQARIDSLIAPHVDPVSGQPELKATPIGITARKPAAYGFAISRTKPDLSPCAYWSLARADAGWRAELALDSRMEPGEGLARKLLRLSPHHEVAAYHDNTTGQFRCAAFADNHLVAALYLAPGPVAVARSWVQQQLGASCLTVRDRWAIVSGRPGGAAVDKGTIICACYDVGRNDIITAVSAGCHTIAAVGAATRAGTNCGSCRMEINALLAKPTKAQAV